MFLIVLLMECAGKLSCGVGGMGFVLLTGFKGVPACFYDVSRLGFIGRRCCELPHRRSSAPLLGDYPLGAGWWILLGSGRWRIRLRVGACSWCRRVAALYCLVGRGEAKPGVRADGVGLGLLFHGSLCVSALC